MTDAKFLKYFDLIKVLLIAASSLLIAMLIIFFASKSSWEALFALFAGPFTSIRRFGNILEYSIPLTFTGLGVAVMFRANQFNLGSDGIFYICGLFISALAIKAPSPFFLFWAVPLTALAGGAAASLPAYLKIKYQASEVVSSLMMNYLFLLLGLYFLNTYLVDPGASYNATALLPAETLLPKIWKGTRLHAGIFIALGCVAFCHVLINKTVYGYTLRMAGLNMKFAAYSGMNTGRIIMGAQFLGGMLAGIGGSVEILGMYTRFGWESLTGYGIDGMIVSLLAKREPLFIPLAALFLAYLRSGASIMANQYDVSVEVVAVIQTVIVVLAGSKNFLEIWRERAVVRQALEEGR